ncbi:MAG: glycoside hydrolase family 38 C-terminal domain-containing protein, partial [Streptosporangiaceae bacterium]
MQFASEFEWISPDGTGLLTSYMANHYGAGWAATHRAPDLETAMRQAHEQFRQLAPVAATPNVLLPVGADHVIPSRWATGIHRDWNERYVWPRFVTALPHEFFAAVRDETAQTGRWMTPQTRDMNPVYTGKDVTYTDTKQGQRAGEIAVTDAERLATLACLVSASHPAAAPFGYPTESLDKAWRQLVFGAHHDAITGTESDQVYLDLLGGWREAWQRGHDARTEAAGYLAGLVDTQAETSVVVFNTLPVTRSALATVALSLPAPAAPWVALTDETGAEVPCLAEGITRHSDGSLAGVTLTFRAADLPALGYRSYPVLATPHIPDGPGWQPLGAAVIEAPAIENQAFEVHADPGAGGTLSRIYDKRLGAELLRPGGVGNELVVQDEYALHPRWNEGQWLLSPKGPGRGLSARAAGVRAERCAIGSRLVSESADGELRFTQETLLWDGADRIEFRTHVDGSIGQDRLLRVRFRADVPGGLPVYQTATAVIGRPPGAADTDVAEHWFTLDSPAYEWFGVGSTVRVAIAAADGSQPMQAVGVAEVITPQIMNGFASAPRSSAQPDTPQEQRAAVRELMAALAARGVTATCSHANGPRYGAIDLDSNLPDVRIALGDGDQNAFTAEVLAAAGPACAQELAGQLQRTGSARIWVPAACTRQDVFAPGTDATGASDLPVLVVAGRGPDGLAAAIRELSRDLAGAVIEATGPAGPGAGYPPLADRCVALLNRGTPSGLVTPDGTLNLSLMRSSSAWPGGVWIDGEKRTA